MVGGQGEEKNMVGIWAWKRIIKRTQGLWENGGEKPQTEKGEGPLTLPLAQIK